MGLALAAALAAVLGGQAQAGSPAAPSAKAARVMALPDPGVREGVLPNGLRYRVMRNPAPKGTVSLRLGIDAGSYEERDDERGVAHFVEHMAFEGSAHFPDGRVDQLFAARGVGAGRDQNAFTTYYATTFYLDLPNADEASLALGFEWLRDVADGVTFPAAAVEREKGVILAEKEARSDAIEDAKRKVAEFQRAGLRSLEREPIGVPDSIRQMTPERLRAFYERWYRPDNAILVVVGDLPVEALEARVKDAFANWKKGAGPIPRASGPSADARRATDALVVSDPHLPSVLSVCHMIAPAPRELTDVERLRRQVIAEIARNVLDARLSRGRTAPSPPYVSAKTSHDEDSHEGDANCIETWAADDAWRPALSATQAELKRFLAEGPTDVEFAWAVKALRAQYRGDADRTSTRKTDDIANDLLSSALERRTFSSPLEDFYIFDRAVEGLKPEDVRVASVKTWGIETPLIVLTAPKPQEKSALLTAWKAGAGAPGLAHYADSAPLKWDYLPSAKPGVVARRQLIAEGDFVRLTFRNGLVLNFKHLDSVKSDVQIRIRFGAGRREVPNDQYITAFLGAMLFEAGGVGRNSYAEIKSLFENGGWGAKLTVSDTAFVLSGATTAGSLDNEMQVLDAYLTDPGFSTQLDAILPTAMDAGYRMYRTQPYLVLAEAMNEAVSPGSPVHMPSLATMSKLRVADFQRILKPIITSDPLEITIVGDIDESQAIGAVGGTLGALPARKPGDRARPDTWFRRFPETPIPPVHVTHEGFPDKALVGAVWPLYVAEPARRPEEMSLILLAKVLEDSLVHGIRQGLGKTYSPVAQTYSPDFADQGMMLAMVETYPADTEVVSAEIRKSAEALARGEITAAQLDEARKPLLTSMRASLTSNSWWASVLDGSARNPGQVKDTLGLIGLIEQTTLEDVRKAAANWLNRPPMMIVATPQPPANAQGKTGR